LYCTILIESWAQPEWRRLPWYSFNWGIRWLYSPSPFD
jgi:hypothetical protein